LGPEGPAPSYVGREALGQLARPRTNPHPRCREAPSVLYREGRIHLIYWASGSLTDDHALGG